MFAIKDEGGVSDDETAMSSSASSSSQKRPRDPSDFAMSKEAMPRKKHAPGGFPQTVKSLTSTGIFDGVPVKYISTSGEEFRGIIKGSGYLCGCETCNFTKVVKAGEFERHSGYKTRHPNCRIYFKNGKTIYRVIQMLRNAPENLLFEKIENATGSPINQKAFSAWQDSFQSARYNLARTVSEVEDARVQ